MNGFFILLKKDYREHRGSIALLTMAVLFIVLVAIFQNRSAPASADAMSVVASSLVFLLPLATFVIGNLLITREYIGNTRQFTAALPIGRWAFLVQKYLTGQVIVWLYALMTIALATFFATAADDLTSDYLTRFTFQLLVATAFFWSLVFLISLCGRFRIILCLLIGAVYLILKISPWAPNELMGPFALIDQELLVYERDSLPVRDIIITVATTAVLIIVSFCLAGWRSGFFIQRLAQPMSRIDLCVATVFVLLALTFWDPSAKESQQATASSSKFLITSVSPDISVYYESEERLNEATEILERLKASLADARERLAVDALPHVRFRVDSSLDDESPKYGVGKIIDISASIESLSPGVAAHIDYFAMHGVLDYRSNGRGFLEPQHWMLDGIARWWSIKSFPDTDRKAINAEWLALAVFAESRLLEGQQLLTHFDRIVDERGVEGAETMAYSAIMFLAERHGESAVDALAKEFFSQPVPQNWWRSVADRVPSAADRFEQSTGVQIDEFFVQWRAWLKNQAGDANVRRVLALIPSIEGAVLLTEAEGGLYQLEAKYTGESGAPEPLRGACTMRYTEIWPLDDYVDIDNTELHAGGCTLEDVVHRPSGDFAEGQRIYAAFMYRHPDLAHPVMLNSIRMEVQ